MNRNHREVEGAGTSQQQVSELLALGRRATLCVREAPRRLEGVSSSSTNPQGPVEPRSVWKMEKRPPLAMSEITVQHHTGRQTWERQKNKSTKRGWREHYA